MRRCLELALKGKGSVMSNPMVGAVLVYNNELIIGEGWHQEYGKEHAEVNCINNVPTNYIDLIALSTLYVSLEPCNHYGKTPPCTQLIIQNGIKKVVIGCKDEHSLVNGAGIQFLKDNGVEVIAFILEQECINLNQNFFYTKKNELPSITLKWAQSADGFIAKSTTARTYITNATTNRYVHKLRADANSILVGSGTVKTDNPQLNNRLYGTKQLTRIIIDRNLNLAKTYNIFDASIPTIIINCKEEAIINGIQYLCIEDDSNFLRKALTKLFHLGIVDILVEGGATILALFYTNGFWNKIIRITNTELILETGISAPTVSMAAQKNFMITTDLIETFYNEK